MTRVVSVSLATLVAALSFSLPVAGDTYYVDASRPDDFGDGLTPQTAKRHIQAAVDLACAQGAGNTVSVAEGVYNEGENVCHWDNRVARVIVTNRVNIVASGRKGKTIIDGGGTTGGVHIYYSTNSSDRKRSADSVVRGFTITNCGGGDFGSALSMYMSFAVDCVFSNNVTTTRGGGTYLGTALRCLYADNGAGQYGSAMFQTVCMNCLIVGQRGGKTLSAYAGALYNCTVAGNQSSGYSSFSSAQLYNTIYVGNSTQAIYADTTVCNKCILSPGSTYYDKANSTVKTDVPAYCFAAPLKGDWRPTRDSGAAEFGDPSYLSLPTLPADLEAERYVDYCGREIPQSGDITCGAVQEIADVEGPLVAFDKPFEVAGCEPMVAVDAMSACSYYWANGDLGMVKFRVLGQPFERVVWYNLTTNAVTSRVAQLAPTLDNWAGLVPYPDCTNKVSLLKANDVYYVDAVNGSDSNDGLSRAKPLASVNAAIAKLPKGSSANYAKTTIVVAPGTYVQSEGSTDDAVVVHGNNYGSFVYRYTRIVAEEGPEKTVIDGRNRTCCVSTGIGLFLQGFTLTGAMGTDVGTAFNSPSVGNGMVADCIVSNNCVTSEKTSNISAAIVRRGRVVRCRFSDNRVNAYAGGVVFQSDVMNSELVEIVPKAHPNSYLVASENNLFFCTAKGYCYARGKYYYSILPDGLLLENDGYASHCYANGATPISATGGAKAENCANGKAGVISWGHCDFRLRPGADALGRVTVDPAAYAPYAQLDMDGNPLSATALSGNAAGAHQLAVAGWTPPGCIFLLK